MQSLAFSMLENTPQHPQLLPLNDPRAFLSTRASDNTKGHVQSSKLLCLELVPGCFTAPSVQERFTIVFFSLE